MSKIDLSRRQFVNVAAAASGLYAMSGMSNLILGEEPQEVGLKKILGEGDSKIPYIGITEDGPLYPPVEIPWLKDFTSVGGRGETPDGDIMYLFGQILDAKGRPVEGAVVEIWQADNNGLYKHPRVQGQLDSNFGYFGKVRTAKDGTYLFKTIVPRWYAMFGITRANHIHVKMRHRDHGVLTTEMYFAGKDQDAIREKDHVFKSRRNGDRLIVPRESPAKYSDLGIQFDDKAACCRFDLAFLL
jgi:protocatechuate 3,4-dioxygenase beta subunit